MSLTETLTVQILGDSSQLESELSRAAEMLDALQERLADAGRNTDDLGEAFGRLSRAVNPLQVIGKQLDQLSAKIRALSQQPVLLNVQPALTSLQQLISAAEAAAAALARVSGASLAGQMIGRVPFGGATTPTPPVTPGVMNGPVTPRGFASGGLVTGPGGIDRVAARLTAGEFVMRQEAVSRIGLSHLEMLNSQPAAANLIQTPRFPPGLYFAEPESGLPRTRQTEAAVDALWPLPRLTLALQQQQQPQISDPVRQVIREPVREESETASARTPVRSAWPPAEPSQQTTNHFGGIEIQVREATDLSSVFDELQRHDITLRHRRG